MSVDPAGAYLSIYIPVLYLLHIVDLLMLIGMMHLLLESSIRQDDGERSHTPLIDVHGMQNRLRSRFTSWLC